MAAARKKGLLLTVTPRGSTRVVGIIGDPITHSRSPAIHNAAFADARPRLGVRGVPGAARRRRRSRGRGARRSDSRASTSRCPTSRRRATSCDELSDAARALRSVNTVVNRDGVLFGDSTDGAGLLAALRDEGVDVMRAGRAGARRRRRGASHRARARRGRRARDGRGPARRRRRARRRSSRPTPRVVDFADLDQAVHAANVIVNATPIGMNGEPPPFAVEALRARPSSCTTPCTTRRPRHCWRPPRPGGSRTPAGSGCWCTRRRSRSPSGQARRHHCPSCSKPREPRPQRDRRPCSSSAAASSASWSADSCRW